MDNYYFHMDNLSVGYDKKALIHDICIGIKKGEIVTLIGPNGSGKSTILKSITRQLQIIGGKVYFDDRNLNSFSYKELSTRMAVVLTERMRPELMTCHDIVATGRYPYTGRLGILSREDEEKVEEAMRAVHAESLGSRDFNNISDGQRQRVLLARAICQEPDIIILDEPTSFLDIKHKLDLLSILRDMAKKKQITVIMSLHEIDLAQKIADKIICVKGDTISHFGKPEDIAKTATSLRIEAGKEFRRFELIAAIMEHFEKAYEAVCEAGSREPIMEDYNRLLVNCGRRVRVLEPEHEYDALALGIDKTGELQVECEDGSRKSVFAGEVSVRGIYGYV